MLGIVIKSWFTQPPLQLGCVFILYFMPLYLAAVLMQIILFLPVLPVIVFVFTPISLYLYSQPEKSFLYWGGVFSAWSILLYAIPMLLYFQVEKAALFAGAFVVLSGMCGMCTYFNLYNSDKIEMTDQNSKG